MSLEIVERITAQMSLRDIQEDALKAFEALYGNGVSFSQYPLEIANEIMRKSKSIKTDRLDLFMGWDETKLNRVLPANGLVFPDAFPRLAFALATGTGKSRLMGALAAYLFLSGKSQHFLFLAPSSEIYRKMIKEARTPGHDKYLFKGLTPFPTPEVYSYENASTLNSDQISLDFDPADKASKPKVFIFTPHQLRARSGSEAERIMRRTSGDEGEGIFHKFIRLQDLVVFLDEGHRFATDDASEERDRKAWTKLITELNPKTVIEMTATPKERSNILYSYSLYEALAEGKYIKDVVAVVETRSEAIQDDEWDKYTLRMALKYHQRTKYTLEVYSQNLGKPKVKPVMLIACSDIDHAKEIEGWLCSSECENGKYNGKVLRVDSSQIESEMAKLMHIEQSDDQFEIIVNVGMLREGWDVINVYTIVPLRATSTITLATQTIGRGLRLPYGTRVREHLVDTLHVMAFGKETVQKVIQEAKKVGVQIIESVVEKFKTDIQNEIHKFQPSSQYNVHVIERTDKVSGKTFVDVKVVSVDGKTAIKNNAADIVAAVSNAAQRNSEIKTENLRHDIPQQDSLVFGGIELKSDKMIPYESKPSREFVFKIPFVTESITRPSIRDFHPILDRSVAVGNRRKAYEVRVGTGELLGSIKSEGLEIKNWPRRLAIILTQLIDDIGGETGETERIFREYFVLAGAETEYEIKKLAESSSEVVFDSVQRQIEKFLQQAHSSLQVMENESEEYRFDSVIYNVPLEDQFIDESKLERWNLEEKRLVIGWNKSLYPEIRFNSNPEFLVARILDREQCLLWIRNPATKFFINTLIGKHYPDFIFITESSITLIEVKRSTELENDQSDACVKAKAAIEWCKIVSEHSTQKWEYLFVPDTHVEKAVTLDNLRSGSKLFT